MHEKVNLDNVEVDGYVIPLEGCNLVFASSGACLLACGAIDVDALDKFGISAAKVTGVETVADLMDGAVKGVNQHATRRGISVGEQGRTALLKMIQHQE